MNKARKVLIAFEIFLLLVILISILGRINFWFGGTNIPIFLSGFLLAMLYQAGLWLLIIDKKHLALSLTIGIGTGIFFSSIVIAIVFKFLLIHQLNPQITLTVGLVGVTISSIVLLIAAIVKSQTKKVFFRYLSRAVPYVALGVFLYTLSDYEFKKEILDYSEDMIKLDDKLKHPTLSIDEQKEIMKQMDSLLIQKSKE